MSFLSPPKVPSVNVPPPPPPTQQPVGVKPGRRPQAPTVLGEGLRPSTAQLGAEALTGGGAATGKTFLGQ